MKQQASVKLFEAVHAPAHCAAGGKQSFEDMLRAKGDVFAVCMHAIQLGPVLNRKHWKERYNNE